MAFLFYRRPAHDRRTTMWFPALSILRRSRSGQRTVHRKRSFPRLTVEALEDRSLPSTLTVSNISDGDPGSLRAQIAAASSGDTIVFASSLKNQTITLTSGELMIDKSLDIEGLGAASLTVSGNDASRVFDIVTPKAKVTIAGLTVAHGYADRGVGIDNAGG